MQQYHNDYNVRRYITVPHYRSVTYADVFGGAANSVATSLTTNNCIIFRDASYFDVMRRLPMTRNIRRRDVAKQRVVARKRDIKRMYSTKSLKP